MTELRFADATLSRLESAFSLKRDFERLNAVFSEWPERATEEEISEFETLSLEKLRQILGFGVGGWNEVELESKFIAPLFGLADFDNGKTGYFMERPLSAEINGIKVYGIADGLIARGTEDPELPFFCMQEYKRSLENKGRPNGQTLAAMLAAQTLNENRLPIYGLFVVGVSWNFMVLDGKSYTISETYSADGKGIFAIFKMLKALKRLITTHLSE